MWTIEQVAVLAGISLSQANKMLERGYVTPADPGGRGRRRRYADRDALAFLFVGMLVDHGFTNAKAGQIANQFASVIDNVGRAAKSPWIEFQVVRDIHGVLHDRIFMDGQSSLNPDWEEHIAFRINLVRVKALWREREAILKERKELEGAESPDRGVRAMTVAEADAYAEKHLSDDAEDT